MKSEQFAPRDNYERNFTMVKLFCGKAMVLLLIILLFLNIVSSVYLLTKSDGQFEGELLKLFFSKIDYDVEFGSYNVILIISNVLLSGFFILCLISIYVKSKNDDYDSSPSNGLYFLYLFSVGEMILFGITFAVMVISTFAFMITKVESLKIIPELLNMNTEQIKDYKVTIVLGFIVIDVVLFFVLWLIQSQTNFLKSIRTSITGSLMKNKGAHTYGVFSLLIGIILLCIAVIITFLYYCYRDALNGLDMKIDELYVYVSIELAYVKGLIPFIIGLLAFSYSNMVDETSTYGTLYTEYSTIGSAEDPNFHRSLSMGSGNKFIR